VKFEEQNFPYLFGSGTWDSNLRVRKTERPKRFFKERKADADDELNVHVAPVMNGTVEENGDDVLNGIDVFDDFVHGDLNDSDWNECESVIDSDESVFRDTVDNIESANQGDNEENVFVPRRSAWYFYRYLIFSKISTRITLHRQIFQHEPSC